MTDPSIVGYILNLVEQLRDRVTLSEQSLDKWTETFKLGKHIELKAHQRELRLAAVELLLKTDINVDRFMEFVIPADHQLTEPTFFRILIMKIAEEREYGPEPLETPVPWKRSRALRISVDSLLRDTITAILSAHVPSGEGPEVEVHANRAFGRSLVNALSKVPPDRRNRAIDVALHLSCVRGLNEEEYGTIFNYVAAEFA